VIGGRVFGVIKRYMSGRDIGGGGREPGVVGFRLKLRWLCIYGATTAAL